MSLAVADQWVQNRSRNRGTALVWGVLGFIGALSTVGCLVGSVTSDVGLLVFAAFFVAFTYGCVRYAVGALRAALFVGRDEIVVRNPLTTIRVRPDEVERFVAGGQDYGFSNPVPGVLMVLRDGDRVRVWTLAREGVVWREKRNIRRWEETATQLNGLLATPVPA